MATEKVGVYRKYHGAIPIDKSGRPLPKSAWPRERPFRWAARWYGLDGKRFSKSFENRKEADRFAERKQVEVRVGKGDQPRATTLEEFSRMYLDLRGDLAPTTRIEQGRTLRFLREFFGHTTIVRKVTSLDARRFVAWYRERTHRGRTPAPATVNKAVRECKRIFREGRRVLTDPRESVRWDSPGEGRAAGVAPHQPSGVPRTDRGIAVASLARHDHARLLLRAATG